MKSEIFLQRISDRVTQYFEQFSQQLPPQANVRNVLLFCVLGLVCIGSIMVMSASMPYAANAYDNPYYFIERHIFYLIVAAGMGVAAYHYPLRRWFGYAPIVLWLFTLLCLTAVLLVGKETNGSARWLSVAGINFQPSELAKFAMTVFTADYVVRRASAVRENLRSSWRLAIPVSSTVLLIMIEPDLGASAVILVTVITIFFLSGAPSRAFMMALLTLIFGLVVFILFEPYRMRRIISFSNPWEDLHGDGYQLSQSLIAFGRGEWLGQGLGHSVQKLSYLPEAHTDFMLAITAEELGFIGISMILALSFCMVVCCMRIAQRALRHHHWRSGYLGYGIATIFLLQICVNAGMNMGLLPTKGLTMPFISYGGSSLVLCAFMIGVVLRIEKESRMTSQHNFN